MTGDEAGLMRVELRKITKRFPGVVANEDVDIEVDPGQVLCLLGENGAGKSTLMNVLYGLYEPTEGEILIDGSPVRFSSPGDAITAGIGMVHQHFMLVPVFTVLENFMLGNEVTGPLGRLDQAATRRRIIEISERYGLEVDPDAVVENLPVGVQQRVEILKALFRDAGCLILDEPTAVLTPPEIAELEGIIRRLAESGKSIIFITHKLAEVMRVADRITVLRRGRVAGQTTPAETDPQGLASMMVGRDVQLVVDKAPATPGKPVLEVRDLVVRDSGGVPRVNGVSFDIRAGEILAVAGVQGNGQTELVEAICGLHHAESGTVTLDGEDITRSAPAELYNLGVAHVPEDRQKDGLVGSFPIADNLVLNTFHRNEFSRRGMLNLGAIHDQAEQLVEDFDVRTPSVDVAVSTLSGGNQQKVIVAREFTHAQRLLVAAQPTRGLDVGSIQYIHGRIVESRDLGTAVMIVSAELDEVMALADRIAVMHRGRFVGIVDVADTTREDVGLMMTGTRREATSTASGTEEGTA